MSTEPKERTDHVGIRLSLTAGEAVFTIPAPLTELDEWKIRRQLAATEEWIDRLVLESQEAAQ